MLHANEQTDYNYCALPLASYACRPDQTRGRLFEEPESKHRTPFQRDRDRIIHATAFRRLKHKTQVFVYHEGDHYRTRLTHSLEVAQIARSIARALKVNEDLTEGVALAHDLGHTPFAHLGEVELDKQMAPYGGFEHNDQSLLIVTKLEEKYPDFDGLNLTWEMLEGIAKHNGPVANTDKAHALLALNKHFDLEITTHASIEAQIAAISDDIAYNNHDIEDGLKAGLFDLHDLEKLALFKDKLHMFRDRWPDMSRHRLLHMVVRETIGVMVEDVLTETEKRIEKCGVISPEDVRQCGQTLVGFSGAMHEMVEELRSFLMTRMYKHYTVRRMGVKARKIVKDLFETYMSDYKCMPDDWRLAVIKAGGESEAPKKARVIANYIAGMTDRYAIAEHKRLLDLYWDYGV